MPLLPVLPVLPARLWLALLLAFYGINATAFSIVMPIFEAPDEHHHYFTARYIAQHQQLPVGAAGTLHRQEGAQPPLYYLLAATLTLPWPTSPIAAHFALNPAAHTGTTDAQNNHNLFLHPPGEDWPWQGDVLVIHLLRFVSVLLGGASLLCIYATARLLWRARPAIALFAVAAVAALPQWLFLHSAVTNDTLLIFLVVLTHCYLTHLWFAPLRPRRWVWVGVLIALAILTKNTGLLLLPYVAGVLLAKARGRINRHTFDAGAAVAIPVILLTVWHFWRNMQLYGDPTAVNVFVELGGGERELPAWFILQHLELLWLSTIAFFGWMNVLAPVWVFIVWIALFTLAGVGAFGGLRRHFSQRKRGPIRHAERSEESLRPAGAGSESLRPAHSTMRASFRAKRGIPFSDNRAEGDSSFPYRTGLTGETQSPRYAPLRERNRAAGQRNESTSTTLLALQATWPILVVAAWFSFNLRTPAEQGRLLFPAIIPVALWLGYGLGHWGLGHWGLGKWELGKWCVRVLPALGIVAAMSTAVYCVAIVLPAAYPRLTVVAAPPSTASLLDQEMGLGIRLVAAQTHTPHLHPGETARFTLYWRADTPVTQPPLVAPELLGRALRPVGDLPPAYHGGGMFPAHFWPRAGVVVEDLEIAVAADARVPTLGRLYLRLQDQEALVKAATVKVVPRQWPAASATLRAELAGGIAIADASIMPAVVSPKRAVPGATLPVQVRWQISQDVHAPLNTFVHLGLPGQPPLAQADGPALGGDYPAHVWRAGELFDDQYMLVLPDDLPFGDYAVMIGLYHTDSGTRLPLYVEGERQRADALLVDWLSVKQP